MNKDSRNIIILCVIVAVLAVAFMLFAFSSKNDVDKQMRYSEERAFSDLITSVSKLDTAIKKAPMATTPKYASSIYAEIWKEAESAKLSLGEISTNEDYVGKLQDFLATTGDYAFYMLKKTAGGEDITEEEIANIKNLASTSEALSIEISDAKKIYNDGDSKTYLSEITMFDEPAITASNMDDQNQVDQNFQAFATMVYDGPFSSHIDKLEPELTKNDTQISESKAKTLVAKFLNTDEQNVEFLEKVDTKIPFYRFTSDKDGENISINITQKGGHILNFTNYREVKNNDLTASEAVVKAEELLAEYGYTDFIKTYYTEFDNIVTVNFAFSQNGVILYPDLLKISVFRDDGSLAGVEARGFVMSHRERADLEPQITKDEAIKSVISELNILDESLAIIPSSGKNEVLCYEFKCQDESNQNCIVYINAKTSEIENILILIEEENGTLAM